MDAEDPLKTFRDKFYIPCRKNGEAYFYFAGHSLGLQPKSARAYIEQELSDWEKLGVAGHFSAKNPWMPYHELLTKKMADVVGAKPIEVVVMNSLTVNLHLLMVSFYRPTNKRNKIVIEKGAFPSDLYAVKSQIRFHGLHTESSLIEIKPKTGETTLHTEDIVELIKKEGESIALIFLGGVNYYTGQAYDMKSITEAGHAIGAKVGFDLAHAAGNIHLQLHDWNVDFAAWCTYKYLNSGPGGISGCFVHEKYAYSDDLPRFAGWWGHDKQTRFMMRDDFKPVHGAEGWQLSNPPIFQMASLRASLDIIEQCGMKKLVEKSKKLTGYLAYLLDMRMNEKISVITPGDNAQRGCQLSISMQNADENLFKKISDKGVIADWREPNVMRVAPVPLYNSFNDVYQFVKILEGC